MTTARSPLRVLKAQADKIAATLKAVDRGEPVANDPAGKIAASRVKGVVTFAVVMDDKVLKIEVPWETIHSSSETALAEFVLNHMREARQSIH